MAFLSDLIPMIRLSELHVSCVRITGTGSFLSKAYCQPKPSSHSHRGFSPVKRAANHQGNRFNGLSRARRGNSLLLPYHRAKAAVRMRRSSRCCSPAPSECQPRCDKVTLLSRRQVQQLVGCRSRKGENTKQSTTFRYGLHEQYRSVR